MGVKKLITISTPGYLPEIRVNGPVKTPTYVKVDAVRALVLNGRRVLEHNPSNPTEKVILNVSNSVKVNFGADATTDKPVDTPKKVDELIAPTNVNPETPVEKFEEKKVEVPSENENPVDNTPIDPTDETPIQGIPVEDETPSTTFVDDEKAVDNTTVDPTTNDAPTETPADDVNGDENGVDTPAEQTTSETTEGEAPVTEEKVEETKPQNINKGKKKNKK